jgi:hypothetical protein
MRKKSIAETSNVRSGFESSERLASERKYYAYSLRPNKQGNTFSESRIVQAGHSAEVGVTDQVMALLHGEPEAGRRMQVQF